MFLVAAIAYLSGCGRASADSGPPTSDGPTRPATTPERYASLRAAALAECGGAAVTTVDLLPAVEQLPDMTPEMFTEQFRDLVALSLLSDGESGISPRDASYLLASRPPVREEWPSPSTVQEHGPTRHLVHEPEPGKAELIVLAPLGDPARGRLVQEEYQEYVVASAAAPAKGRLIGYLVDLERLEAHYCTLAQGEPEVAFRPRAGWLYTEVRSQADLASFLARNPNLVEATCREGTLGLWGIPDAQPADAPVTLEHVASIYQPPPSSELQRDRDAVALAKEIPGIADGNAALAKELARRKRLYPATNAALWLAADTMHLARTAARDLPAAAFSPATSKREQVRLLARDLLANGRPLEPRFAFSLDPRHSPDTVAKIAAARTIEENRAAMEGLRKTRQCARYDGPSRGTEAGMVLFYTDLGMKLYGHNTGQIVARAPLPGFTARTELGLSQTECRDSPELTQAALWLELRPDRLRVEHAELSFSPSATGVFGKLMGAFDGARHVPRASLDPGTRRQVTWWTDHYRDIAAVDHEYARLDQLLKWGAVVAWLADQPNCHGNLRFLGDTPVRRDWTYPSWLEANRERLWQPATPVVTAEAGDECLPVLVTPEFEECGGPAWLAGGVAGKTTGSLAEMPKPIASHPPAFKLDPELRTATVKTVGRSRTVVRDGVRKQFMDEGTSAAVATSKADAQLGLLLVHDAAGQRLVTAQTVSPSTLSVQMTGAGRHRAMSLVRESRPDVVGKLEADLRAGKSLAESLRKHKFTPRDDGLFERSISGAKGKLIVDASAGVDKFVPGASRVAGGVGKASKKPTLFTFVVDDAAVRPATLTQETAGVSVASGAALSPNVTPRGPPIDLPSAQEAAAARDFAALQRTVIDDKTPPWQRASLEAYKAVGEIGVGDVKAGLSRLKAVPVADISLTVARDIDGALARQVIESVRAGRAEVGELRAGVLAFQARRGRAGSGDERATSSLAQARSDGSIAGAQPQSPFMSVAAGPDGALKFDTVDPTPLRSFAPGAQGSFPGFTVRTGEPTAKVAEPATIELRQGVLGQPTRADKPAASRPRTQPWSDFAVGKYRDSSRRVLLSRCDRDDNGDDVDESEWTLCVCDEDFDGVLALPSERNCARQERSIRLQDKDPALSREEWAVLHCDQDGDGALALAPERSCRAAVLP